MGKEINMIGFTAGFITVIARSDIVKHNSVCWICKCKCGKIFTTSSKLIRAGDVRSCGCKKRLHGLKHGHNSRKGQSSTYTVWHGMIQRCENPLATGYKYYGGRGIIVCERWHDFQLFLADMGERPAKLTLDREDNYHGYEPGNCKWSTRAEQDANKRPRRKKAQVPGVGGAPTLGCT